MALLALPAGSVRADGTEALGPTPIAPGTKIIGEGVGLRNEPGSIEITVPAGAGIVQVLLYWNGFSHNALGDDTLTLDNGIDPPVSVTGDLIGGPRTFFNWQVNGVWTPVKSTTYRADITALGLIGTGLNSVAISDLDFGTGEQEIPNGASLLIVLDEGTTLADLQLRDGQDLAFANFATPLMTTVPQTFFFTPATYPRTAEINFIAGSVAGETSRMGTPRPNIIRATTGGVVTDFVNELSSTDGEEWDHLLLSVEIPAGAGSLTLQALSEPDGSEQLPASLAWLVSALSIPAVGEIGDFVWCDSNNNGIYNPGEMVVEGVVVRLTCAGPDGLTGTADDLTDMTVTDATGHYLFQDVEAGMCMVELDQSTIPAGKTVGKCAPMVMVDLGPGESYLDADFCIFSCAECKGKVSELTLRYLGPIDATITVTTKKGVIFDGLVPAGGLFDLIGNDKGTLGTEITISVAGGDSIAIHTSCSKPIGPGMIFGDFEVVSGSSLEGGPLCPLGPPSPCDGNKLCGLVLRYTGEDCSASSHDQGAKATCIGDPAGAPEVRVRVSDDEDHTSSGADVYFDGVVSLGGTLEALALNAGGTKLTSNTVIHVFDLADNLLQTVELHTSCSQPIHLGDQFGSLVVDGFTTEDECKNLPSQGPDGLCDDGKPCGLTLRYTGEDCSASVHGQDSKKFFCAGDPAGAPEVWIRVSDKEDPTKKAKVWFEGTVLLGETFEASALNIGKDKLKSKTFAHVFDPAGNLLQLIEFHTSCSQPLALGDQFGSLVLEGFTTKDECKALKKAMKDGDDGLCELGKPAALTLLYGGEPCSDTSHSQDAGKVSCAGTLDGEAVVVIRASDSEDPDDVDQVWFEGMVALGESFEVAAAYSGEDRLKNATFLHVWSLGGDLIQSIEFHTSCSQPLELGDQFGAFELVGFTPDS